MAVASLTALGDSTATTHEAKLQEGPKGDSHVVGVSLGTVREGPTCRRVKPLAGSEDAINKVMSRMTNTWVSQSSPNYLGVYGAVFRAIARFGPWMIVQAPRPYRKAGILRGVLTTILSIVHALFGIDIHLHGGGCGYPAHTPQRTQLRTAI